MKERPILFSGEMVRAILEGRKSQTRRVVKPQPHASIASFVALGDCFKPGWSTDDWTTNRANDEAMVAANNCITCPYGVVGDRLYVREATRYYLEECYPDDWEDEVQKYDHYRFAASPKLGMRKHLNSGRVDAVTYLHESTPLEADHEWPRMERIASIFMPRWASRLTLETTCVRVERLREISDTDCLAEGCAPSHSSIDPVSRELGYRSWPQSQFAQTWDHLNEKRGYGWDKNPWVWVLEFRVAPVSSAGAA